MTANQDYTPIACGFHDRLEDWAVRRETVEILWRSPEAEHSTETTIDDLFAKDGADWVRLGTGETVRADALISVGGVALTMDC